MDNKELKIVAPNGYEIDKENSTFECIKFKPIEKKKLTYDDIAKELFESKETFWMGYNDCVSSSDGVDSAYSDVDNCTSEKQVQKLMAINKLLNVCKHLNNGWIPDWNNDHERKWYLEQDESDIIVDNEVLFNSRVCYFKSKELAQQAIEILGEDTIRLALSTDW